MDYDGAHFAGMHIDADIHGLTYADCHFENCQFGNMALKDVVFTNCVFSDCVFKNVDVSLLRMQNTVFHTVACIGIDWSEIGRSGKLFPLFKEIRGCTLKFNSFYKNKLPKMPIVDSALLDCAFIECDLSGSVFRNSDFLNTTFQDCDLSKADFRQAKHYRINTASNRLQKARFSLPEVLGLLDNLDILIE
ncbi:MAG: pentapeptide repeat-containing protein [Planctomycetaceae bacterium]|nr:pentapeptide repeat-containing protein [Planctomycetaceae bacterium]